MNKMKKIAKLLGKGLAEIIVWFWFSFVWLYMGREIMSLFYKTTDPINWMNSLRLLAIFTTYIAPIMYLAFKLFIPAFDSLSQIYHIIKNKTDQY